MTKSILIRIWSAIFLILFPVLLLSGQPASDDTNELTTSVHDNSGIPDSLRQQIDSLFYRYDTTGVPGAVVGVMMDGELAFAKGYGMADITHNIPITPDTRFNIASISKQFTGFGFAMLAAQGKLSLDDPARKYMPEIPEFDKTVTLRHMLSHTSGYREAYGTLALRGLIPGNDRLPREQTLEVIERQTALEYTPGSNWKYNSTAYVVLAMILEKVTGESFPMWMDQHVFNPTGMEHTVIESEIGQVVPGAATSYYYDDEDSTYTTAFSNRAIFGSAEMYTTVGDLTRWMQNFQTAEVGGEQVQEMLLDRFVLNNGDTTTYALGINVDRERGLKRIHHSGGHAAYGSKLNYYPELNAGVIVMSNNGDINATRKASKIARIFFEEHMDLQGEEEKEKDPYVKVDSAVIARYEGRYKTEDGGVLSIEKRNNSLLLERSAGNYFLLHPTSETVFQTENQRVQLTFQPASHEDKADKATLTDSVKISLTRIPSFTPTLSDLKKFTGRYVSPEIEAIYSVNVRDSQLVASHRMLGELQLSPVANAIQTGTFETTEGSIHPTLQFEQNKMGVITGFYATLWGTSNVWFQRME